MIPTLKNYISGRGKRLALLAIWIVLSAAVVLSLPGSQSTPPTPQTQDNTATSVASATSERNEAPSSDTQTAPANESTTQPTQQSSQPTSSSTQPKPKAKPAAAKISVSLSIDDQFKGNVSLPSTSNQCDVLTQALSDGIISSLQMKYYDELRSYGVHVINGVGDIEEVEWVYEVEEIKGRSLLGCSLTKVLDGDEINWEYVK